MLTRVDMSRVYYHLFRHHLLPHVVLSSGSAPSTLITLSESEFRRLLGGGGFCVSVFGVEFIVVSLSSYQTEVVNKLD
jgi:hypothetical protein